MTMGLSGLSGLLGLATRARQAVFGETQCQKSLRAGECVLLLVDETISPGQLEKMELAAKKADVPIWRLPEGEIWAASGRDAMTMAIKKGSLGDRLRGMADLYEETLPENPANHSGGASVE